MSDFSCPICFDSANEDSLFKLSHGDCVFCKPCLQQYVEQEIRDPFFFGVNCPGHKCKNVITDKEISQLIDSTSYEVYRASVAKLKKEAEFVRTLCPAVGCGAICSVHISVFQKTASTSRLTEKVSLSSQDDISIVGIIPKSLSASTSLNSNQFSYLTKSLAGSKSHLAVATKLYGRSVPVHCPVCKLSFCLLCRTPWSADHNLRCSASDKRGSRRIRFGKQQHGVANMKKQKTSRSQSKLTKMNSEQASTKSFSSRTHAGNGISSPMDISSSSVAPAEVSNQCAETEMDYSVVGPPPYPPDSLLKRCPRCLVPIMRGEGCAQMTCKSCHHTFCWHCLASLENDIMLRHYDSGQCKNKLGHSRAGLFGHRICLIALLTGAGILVIFAVPFIIIFSPFIIFTKWRRLFKRKRRHLGGKNANPTQGELPRFLPEPGGPIPTGPAAAAAAAADIHWRDSDDDESHHSLEDEAIEKINDIESSSADRV